jgi:hypothetical protein
MKIFIKATIVTLSLSLTTLYAAEHHNHSHSCNHDYQALKNEVSKTTIKNNAKKKVQKLVLEKKVPKSWKSVPISKIGKTHYGNTDDWVVGFDNLKIKDKSKQTLYIFVSVHGKIMGANYTGK